MGHYTAKIKAQIGTHEGIRSDVASFNKDTRGASALSHIYFTYPVTRCITPVSFYLNFILSAYFNSRGLCLGRRGGWRMIPARCWLVRRAAQMRGAVAGQGPCLVISVDF